MSLGPRQHLAHTHITLYGKASEMCPIDDGTLWTFWEGGCQGFKSLRSPINTFPGCNWNLPCSYLMNWTFDAAFCYPIYFHYRNTVCQFYKNACRGLEENQYRLRYLSKNTVLSATNREMSSVLSLYRTEGPKLVSSVTMSVSGNITFHVKRVAVLKACTKVGKIRDLVNR